MSNDKMREEFEAWVLGKWPETELGQFNDGEYCGFTLQHCWAAWQASRAAVVVQMPQQSGVNRDWNQAIRYCIQAVEAEGLGWKP